MNMIDSKPESMTYETSAIKSMADITFTTNSQTMEVTLDFRQIPGIKIDAISKLGKPNAETCLDLHWGMIRFANFLMGKCTYLRDAPIEGVCFNGDDPYEMIVSLDRVNWNSPGVFALELSRYLREEAGIVLTRQRDKA